ncbi:MAG: hypothetical protein AMXMBFR82_19890 [Candidatus Hydrogenedentota bacterium]
MRKSTTKPQSRAAAGEYGGQHPAMKRKQRLLKNLSKKLPLSAEAKGGEIQDPCAELTGVERKKCECKAYKGGVVY